MEEKLKLELAETREQHIAALEENEILNDRIDELKEEVDKWNHRATKVRKAYVKMKEKGEMQINELKYENEELKDTIRKDDLSMRALTQEIVRTEKLLHKEKVLGEALVEKNELLQMRIEELIQTIENLQKDMDKLSKLHRDLVEKNIGLQNNNREMNHLKRAVRDLQDQVHTKTETISLLRAAVQELQKTVRPDNEKQLAARGGRVEKAQSTYGLKLDLKTKRTS